MSVIYLHFQNASIDSFAIEKYKKETATMTEAAPKKERKDYEEQRTFRHK